MYCRTIYCHGLMDMLYCPHETEDFLNRWSLLRVERSSSPENRRFKQIYLPVSKNMCTMVHLSTCTNGTNLLVERREGERVRFLEKRNRALRLHCSSLGSGIVIVLWDT